MDLQMNRDEHFELVVHNGNSMGHDILSNIQIEDQNISLDSDSKSVKKMIHIWMKMKNRNSKSKFQSKKRRIELVSFSYSNKDLCFIHLARYTSQERYHS